MNYPKNIRERVEIIRSSGKSFGEIQKIIGYKVPKSTLSGWLKNIPLPNEYKERVIKQNYLNLRKAREQSILIAKKNKLKLIKSIKDCNGYLKKLINKDIGKLLLSVLYLGEGAKRPGLLMLGNSDVNIIKLFIKLLKRCYKITDDRIKCRISYRTDQNIMYLTNFWSKKLNIPIKNFYKTIPDPRTMGRNTKKEDYKGVCVVHILKSARIHLELKIISEIIMGR